MGIRMECVYWRCGRENIFRVLFVEKVIDVNFREIIVFLIWFIFFIDIVLRELNNNCNY